MLIREILEAQEWRGFKGSQSSRVWYNAHTGNAITTDDNGNHSVGVIKNQKLFGLTATDLSQSGIVSGEKILDYDGRVLFAAMKKDWVRLYIDTKSPDINSNAEGISLGSLRRAFIWYCEQIGTPIRFILVVRTGTGDGDGIKYPLHDADQIEWFIQKGTIRRDIINYGLPAQVKQANLIPHFRRN